MYQDKTIAVVVPAHNESKLIHLVVEGMPDYVDHIVIVDDKSPDNTVEVVKKLAENEPRILLIEHEVNQGVGGAIASGYEWARASNVDMAVVMAGDGQMNPDDMTALLEPVVRDGVNYSKANRLIVNRAIDKVPFVRFFGNSVLSIFRSKLTTLRIELLENKESPIDNLSVADSLYNS